MLRSTVAEDGGSGDAAAAGSDKEKDKGGDDGHKTSALAARLVMRREAGQQVRAGFWGEDGEGWIWRPWGGGGALLFLPSTFSYSQLRLYPVFILSETWHIPAFCSGLLNHFIFFMAVSNDHANGVTSLMLAVD